MAERKLSLAGRFKLERRSAASIHPVRRRQHVYAGAGMASDSHREDMDMAPAALTSGFC
jgi:hypothetical protein